MPSDNRSVCNARTKQNKKNMINLLKFSIGNTKLQKGESIFDLPAGHSCPFAHKCFAKADKLTGKITDGGAQEYRCYAASAENYLPSVRNKRWNNFELIRGAKTRESMAKLIETSLPHALVYRVHSSGDFFSQDYFDAWMDVARAHPERIFYAYTKALPFWIMRINSIPKNFKLNASYGGRTDYLIREYKLKHVRVVNSVWEARKLGLALDHDDSHAWKADKSFALLIHGNGKPGSKQAKIHSRVSRRKRAEKLAQALVVA